MNLENIIVIGVCLAAVAIATFYFYNRCASQKKDLIALNKRCEVIEMILTKPPSQHDLSSVYNRKNTTPPHPSQSRASQPPLNSTPSNFLDRPFLETTEPPMLIPQKCETEGLCDLQPFQLETNEAEIDEIVEDELSKVLQADLGAEKLKKSPPKHKK